MQTTTRRVFLGSAAAAGAAGLFPTVMAQHSMTGMAGDPVLAEILTQLENAARDLQRGPSAATARRIAALYRLRTAWGRSHGFDAELREHLARAIASGGGEQAILARVAQWDVAAEMKMAGYTLPAPFATVTAADAGRVLSELRSKGAVQKWDALATMFENGAGRLSTVTPVAARLQYDVCDNLRAMEIFMEAQEFFFCFILGVACPECCIIATVDLLMFKAWMWWNWC